jgi:membrane protein YqaA with SNARE-associated domain
VNLSKKQKYVLAFALTLFLSFILFFFQEKFIQFKTLGLVGLFIISVIGGMLFLPSPVLIASVLAAGRAYNPFLVAVIASLGSAVGDVLGYGVGYTGREAFLDKQKWHHKIAEEIFHQYGGILILVLSAIPNPIFDAFGVIAGLFLYPLKKFLLYIFMGRLIRNLLLAFLGSAL